MPGFGHGFAIDRNPARGSSAPASTTGLAANRGMIGQLTRSATNLTYKSEHWASPQGAISNVRPLWTGIWADDNTKKLINAPANYTIEASLEYPAGTFTRITFSGGNQGVVPLGGVLTPDPVAITIPAGARFWVRTYVVSIASGTVIPCSNLAGVPNTTGATDGAITGNSVMSGTINPSSTGNTHGPFAIMGTIASAGTRGYLLIGDSVMQGVGDTTGVGAKGGAGTIQRALDPLYPYAILARPSGLAQSYELTSSLDAQDILLAAMNALGGYTDVISNFGINDIKTGTSPAAEVGYLQTIFARYSGKRTYQTTLGPRTTSITSNWTLNPGDQVKQIDGQWASYPTFNASVRSGFSGLTGAIEVGNLFTATQDDGFWKANTPQLTGDGTHPSTTGASQSAAAVTIP